MAKKATTAPAKKKQMKNFWHEVKVPYEQTERFKGVSIGFDKRFRDFGYFVFTHRARSKSYSSIARIPDSIIKKIEETG